MSILGKSLAIQWLRLCTSTARGMGLIPGQGTETLHDVWHGQKKKKKECLELIYYYDYY